MQRTESRQSHSSNGGGAGKKKHKNRGSPDPGSRPGTPVTDMQSRDSSRDGAGREPVPADAMVLDRSVEGGLDGVLGMSRSQLVGFDGLVVEVDEQSKGICSVQVWRDPV